MPLIKPAKLRGIIKRPGGTDMRSAIPSTTGMKIATTPVELMTEPRPAAASISRTRRRFSLPPALVTSKSPNLVGNTGANKPFSNDEQGGDQDDVRIAETGQRFRHANDAAQRQDDNCQKGDHVHARFIGNEHSDAGEQQTDNQKQLRVHSGSKAITISEGASKGAMRTLSPF